MFVDVYDKYENIQSFYKYCNVYLLKFLFMQPK